MISAFEVERLFSRVRTPEGLEDRLDSARSAHLWLATWMLQNVPPGPEQDQALVALRQSMMWSMDGITRRNWPDDA